MLKSSEIALQIAKEKTAVSSFLALYLDKDIDRQYLVSPRNFNELIACLEETAKNPIIDKIIGLDNLPKHFSAYIDNWHGITRLYRQYLTDGDDLPLKAAMSVLNFGNPANFKQAVEKRLHYLKYDTDESIEVDSIPEKPKTDRFTLLWCAASQFSMTHRWTFAIQNFNSLVVEYYQTDDINPLVDAIERSNNTKLSSLATKELYKINEIIEKIQQETGIIV